LPRFVVVVASENVHVLSNSSGSVIGAGRRWGALLGCLGDIDPGARVRIKGSQVKVGAMSIKPSKDVYLGAHQARCVARKIGDFIAFNGGEGEGFGLSVEVDDLIEALGVSLLSSNVNNVRSDDGCRVLESLGRHSAGCLGLIAPFEAPRLGEKGLLGEILFVIKWPGSLMDDVAGNDPPIALAELPPEHVLRGQTP